MGIERGAATTMTRHPSTPLRANAAALALLLCLALLTPTPTAVANRCAGESAGAVPECACSVLNRIRAGWNPARVLDAYFAADKQATPAQVQAVADVLSGAAACPSDYYFMFSRADIRALGIEGYAPAGCVGGVCFFGRWFRQGGAGEQ